MTRAKVACDILVLDNHKSRSKDVLNYSAFFTTLLSDFIQAFAPIHLPGLSSRLDFVSFPQPPSISSSFCPLHSLCIRGSVYISFIFYPV